MAASSLPDVYEARLGDVVRAVRDVLRRRYLVLVTIALIVMLIGVNLTYLIAPRYYGTVLIQIDPSQDPLSKSRNGPQADLASEAIETRVTALQSLDLARAVITRLHLMRDPQARAEVARALAHNSALSADQQIDVVANWLEKHLTIAREKMTYVISIRYSSTSPEMAARVANEFAAAYLDGMVNNTTGTASKQSVFFQKPAEPAGQRCAGGRCTSGGGRSQDRPDRQIGHGGLDHRSADRPAVCHDGHDPKRCGAGAGQGRLGTPVGCGRKARYDCGRA